MEYLLYDLRACTEHCELRPPPGYISRVFCTEEGKSGGADYAININPRHYSALHRDLYFIVQKCFEVPGVQSVDLIDFGPEPGFISAHGVTVFNTPADEHSVFSRSQITERKPLPPLPPRRAVKPPSWVSDRDRSRVPRREYSHTRRERRDAVMMRHRGHVYAEPGELRNIPSGLKIPPRLRVMLSDDCRLLRGYDPDFVDHFMTESNTHERIRRKNWAVYGQKKTISFPLHIDAYTSACNDSTSCHTDRCRHVHLTPEQTEHLFQLHRLCGSGMHCFRDDGRVPGDPTPMRPGITEVVKLYRRGDRESPLMERARRFYRTFVYMPNAFTTNIGGRKLLTSDDRVRMRVWNASQLERVEVCARSSTCTLRGCPHKHLSPEETERAYQIYKINQNRFQPPVFDLL